MNKRNILLIVCSLILAAVLMHNSLGQDEVPGSSPFFAMDTCAPTGQMSLIKNWGYAGFSWRPGPEMGQIIKDAARLNLKVYSVYAGLTLNSDGLSGDHLSTITALKDKGVMIWLPIMSKDFKVSSSDGDAVAVPDLRRIADSAASNNVRIALYPHTGFWVERIQDAVRIAKKVNRPNFGVTFNLCHCLMVGDEEKIPELLTESLPYLFLVTINGADTGAGRTKWDRLIRPLDEGSKDLLPVLKRLKNLGYRGPIGLQGYGVKLPEGENLKRSWAAWQKLNKRLAEENN